MSENGKIIEDAVITWNPLEQETKKEIADTRKVDADTDAVYINANVITKEEVRKALREKNPRYSFLKEETNEEK